MLKTKIKFSGGADTVTGSNFYLDIEGLKILVDCGLFQGFKFASDDNRKFFDYEPSEIDYLFVTHAHIDHIGRIPKLVRDGFKGVIYSTPETKMIAEPMFADALSLMRSEEEKSGAKAIYDNDDVASALFLWKETEYGKEVDIDKIKVIFHPSGHILGSALVEIKGEKSILFTGDLGNKNNLLLDEAVVPKDIEYLVTESVYGNRNHETKEVRHGKLQSAIEEVIKSGGTLIVPAFSLERTQHILYEINNLVEDGKVRSISVYLDSPLAIKLTEIYKKSSVQFKKEIRDEIKSGDDIFDFPALSISKGRDDSEAIYDKPSPKIILAGSGMSMGGRVIFHEKKYLSDPKNIILFVGYQAVGSLGRRIAEGERKVEILGEKIKVRAKVLQIEGYSSHRDSDGLVEYVEKISPKKVFVVMGEPKASTYLAQRIKEELDIEAVVPEKSATYEVTL
ncbi:MAG: MBL fold metallo-hydrolase [Patescibacteria group bacterium]